MNAKQVFDKFDFTITNNHDGTITIHDDRYDVTETVNLNDLDRYYLGRDVTLTDPDEVCMYYEIDDGRIVSEIKWVVSDEYISTYDRTQDDEEEPTGYYVDLSDTDPLPEDLCCWECPAEVMRH